jgi:hypothetical protein
MRSAVAHCNPGLILLLALASPSAAGAAEFTPVSQVRQVRVDAVDSTTGYLCVEPIAGRLYPGCPVDLGTTTPSDVASAPDFDPLSATAATSGGSASQDSTIGATSIAAAGSSEGSASASEMSDPDYLIVLHFVDVDTDDELEVTVTLDEAAEFELEASGQIAYLYPALPVQSFADLEIVLTGPGDTEVAAFRVAYDLGCTPGDLGLCNLAPPPLLASGELEPGSHTLRVQLTTSAEAGYHHGMGPLAGFVSGSYATELRLSPDGAPVPALAWPARLLLVGVLLAVPVAARRFASKLL